VRFTRLEPATTDELKQAVLDDLDAVSEGLRAVASGVQLPDMPPIDLLAGDHRGRLTILSFALTAGTEELAAAVAQWGWAAKHLPALRSLMSSGGLDLSAEPRVILVACRALESARLLAAHISRPEVRMVEATLIEAGDRRGLLTRTIPALPLPAAPDRAGLDPVLSVLPPGEPRSLMRRVLEELHDGKEDASPIEAVPLDGGVDLIRSGTVVATLVSLHGEVQLRQPGDTPPRRIGNDGECHEAVAWLAGPQESPAAADGPARDADASPIAAALTAEEVAEFEKFAAETAEPRHGMHDASATLGFARSRFVEN